MEKGKMARIIEKEGEFDAEKVLLECLHDDGYGGQKILKMRPELFIKIRDQWQKNIEAQLRLERMPIDEAIDVIASRVKEILKG